MSQPPHGPLASVRNGLGLGLGLAAAGMTAAAGLAADRLSHDRRVAIALDEQQGSRVTAYDEVPDREFTVVASDGVDLHVEVDDPRGPLEIPAKDGESIPTVVFCHGFCLSLRCWVFQRRALRSAGYRVVLWDQRGHGKSGRAGTDSYHIDQLGSDLKRVLEEVVPEGPVILVGHSMGGMTIMALGLHHPEVVEERVIGAAFVATSTGGLSGASFGLGAAGGMAVHRFGSGATRRLSRLQNVVDASVRAGRDVTNFLVDWGSFGSPVPMSIAQLTSEMIFGTRMDVISAFLPHFDRHDKREALAHYHGMETLVLNGKDDKLTPPAHSDEIVRLLPGSEHVVIEDAGHVIMLEHPTVLNEQLLALVERARRAQRHEQIEERPHVPIVVTDLAGRRAVQAADRVAAESARAARVARSARPSL